MLLLMCIHVITTSHTNAEDNIFSIKSRDWKRFPYKETIPISFVFKFITHLIHEARLPQPLIFTHMVALACTDASAAFYHVGGLFTRIHL